MFGQPKALFYLSSTEMWERFSYYGMRAILVLYMIAQAGDHGLGWDTSKALQIYGLYTCAAWLLPLVGGVLADRYLGQRLAIMLGSVIIASGHFLLAIPSISAFYAGLTCIAVGTGFFKPCVTSILGGLYGENDGRRDAAYSIFYMGINLGSIIGSLATGWLQVTYNFHYGFSAAGFGMILSMAIFWYARRFLGELGKMPSRKRASSVEREPLTPLEKRRAMLVLLLALLQILYFMAYEQAGGLLTIYAYQLTDRHIMGWEVPASWFTALNSFFIILFAPLMSALWSYLGRLGKDPSIVVKIALGFLLTGVAFVLLLPPTFAVEANPGTKVGMVWLVLFYAIYTLAELFVIPMVWSTVSKLAPARYLSLLMGVVLASIGVGSYLAGYVGSFVSQLGAGQIFTGITCVMFGFGIFCLLSNRRLMALSEMPSKEEKLAHA